MGAMSAAGRHRRRLGAALAAPAAMLLMALVIGPSLAALALSFSDYRLGMGWADWVGGENYVRLAEDRSIARSLSNTLIFVAVVAPLSIFGALWIAILVSSVGSAGRLFQTIFVLPVTATLVAMATAWEVVLHPTFGVFNAFLSAIGISPQRFLSDPDLALGTLAAIAVWKLLGYNVVLFLAGMATIDRNLYDAAALDNADGGWRRFELVTWPMLGPVTVFVTVITLIRTLSEFELVAVLTQGGPDGATEM
ncbi:MAG: sugar ABC transporter permease, partial [Pseudomonadota bacterium]